MRGRVSVCTCQSELSVCQIATRVIDNPDVTPLIPGLSNIRFYYVLTRLTLSIAQYLCAFLILCWEWVRSNGHIGNFFVRLCVPKASSEARIRRWKSDWEIFDLMSKIKFAEMKYLIAEIEMFNYRNSACYKWQPIKSYLLLRNIIECFDNCISKIAK